MNYLAHAFLSDNEPGLLVGNFIADHLGSRYDHLPEHIAKGVILHRKIDSFTDHHPLFKESKRLFYDGFEKYSGVLIDIYFDHILARNYEDYSEKILSHHSQEIYRTYQDHISHLPKSSVQFLEYVLRNDIYNAYATEEGIEKVLYHLSHRINHGVRLDGSMTIFRKHQDELEQNFRTFFGEAIQEFKSQ